VQATLWANTLVFEHVVQEPDPVDNEPDDDADEDQEPDDA
jgi:hypothetical protein